MLWTYRHWDIVHQSTSLIAFQDSTCQRWNGTAPWSSRWSQLPAPPLRTQCSARSSYSRRECMLQLPTTYRGVCLSITLFCHFPRPRAYVGLCRTRNWIMCLIMSSISSSSPPLPSLHYAPRPLLQLMPLAPAESGGCGRCTCPSERAQSQVVSSHITCSQTDIGGGGADWAGYRADEEKGDHITDWAGKGS